MALPALFRGEEVPKLAAVISKSVMAILSLGFVAACVWSFISARRSRLA